MNLRSELHAQFESEVEQGLLNDNLFSEYNIPLVLIRKTDKTFRICCDARRANQQILDDSFPLPNMMSTLENIGVKISSDSDFRQNRRIYFTKIDLMSAYRQLLNADEDVAKWSFSFGGKSYAHNRLVFGVRARPRLFLNL